MAQSVIPTIYGIWHWWSFPGVRKIFYIRAELSRRETSGIVTSSSSSALQLWKSLGFLNNRLPIMSIFDRVWPFYHFQLFQIVFDVVFPSGLGSAYWSICEWVSFIYFLYNARFWHSICVRTNLISEIWHSLLCSCVVLVHLIPYSF